MMGLISKIAGPKVLLGVLVFALISLSTLGYLLLDAYEEKGEVESENRRLLNINAQNEREINQAIADYDRKADLVEQGRQVIQELRGNAAALKERAREAESEASDAFRRCMAMPVPDGMRVEAGRPDQDGSPDS